MEFGIKLLLLMTEAALATFVLTRASSYRPAQFFVGVVVTFAILNSRTFLPILFTQPEQMYVALAIYNLNMGVFGLVLLWNLSQLFMPQWWQGRRPIIWISLPYVLILFVFAIDLVGGFGWFVQGLAPSGLSLRSVMPGAAILSGLYTLSWFVPIVMLGFALREHREARWSIIWLIASFVFTLAIIGINAQFKLFSTDLEGLFSTVPLLGTLAYIVLRTSLLVPTRAALELALRSLSDAVMVLSPNGRLLYVNEAAQRLGFQVAQPFEPQLRSGLAETETALVEHVHQALVQGERNEVRVQLAGRYLAVAITPVLDASGQQRGTLLLGRDITESEQRTAELEQRTREQQELLDLVAVLDVPIIALADGVLIAPMMGQIDQRRSKTLLMRLLEAAYSQRARTVILDLTGVPHLDAAAAAALLHSAQALKLLGCQVLLSGISAPMATTLAQQDGVLSGLLSSITTIRSPQEALDSVYGSPTL